MKFDTITRRTAWLFTVILGLLLLGTTTFVYASPNATTRYVSAMGGADVGDCSTSVSPCKTIQYAVRQSVSGDTIKVAQGTYNYSMACNSVFNPNTPAVVCFVDMSLTILGGYSTSNWSSASPNANPTIIDGQNLYRGVAVIGANTQTTNLDMEGFTIQNCKATGPTYPPPINDPSGVGGGMWVTRGAVTLRDIFFKNNQAVGAITSTGAGGDGVGAGLRIESSPIGTSSLLERVSFTGNVSQGATGPDRGGIAYGAMFVYNSSVTVNQASFLNNQAFAGSSSGSGNSGCCTSEALGGGVGVELGSNVVLRRVTVSGNQVVGGNAGTNAGGGYGAGIFAENASRISIFDSSITNNSASGGNAVNGGPSAGGGIMTQDAAQAIIDRVQVISNSVSGGNSTNGLGASGPAEGGGIFIFSMGSSSPPAAITNTIISDNYVAGGSVGTNPSGGGGGISIQGAQAYLTHVTIARNRLGPSLVSGLGLLVLPWPPTGQSATANVNYSIIADHTTSGAGGSAVLVQPNATLNLNLGLFAGNSKNTNSDNLPTASGIYNGLGTMLNSSAVGFVSPGSPNYNYHINASSPAKDKAVGSLTPDDFDGQSRPFNNISDIGADEYWTPQSNFLYLPFVVR